MERCISVPSGSLQLAGVLHLPEGRPGRGGAFRAMGAPEAGPGPLPGVVCAHGLESGKESRKFVEIARALEGEVAVLRFDQRGCGESPGEARDWEGRLGDLRAAVAFLRSQKFRRVGPVGLVGSSFGGYISLRVASEGEAAALVCLASPARMTGMADGREAAARVKCPALFIHGTRDAVVPPARSRELWERVPAVKELCLVDGADHRFSEEAHRRLAVDLASGWLRAHLKRRREPGRGPVPSAGGGGAPAAEPESGDRR
ncbi:MAG: alpha/beta fold hydrolase [Halobacteria archaeon]